MNKRIRSVLKSFYCALRGIAFCLRHERHLRIHLVATAYVLYFASFYGFTPAEYAVLILTCVVVIALELINTAIEVVIDKVSPRFNIFAMMGKDVAAGAVLFGAIGAIAIGITMLWDIAVFVKIWEYFTSDFIKPSILLVSIVASIIFIATTKKRRVGSQRNKEEN